MRNLLAALILSLLCLSVQSAEKQLNGILENSFVPDTNSFTQGNYTVSIVERDGRVGEDIIITDKQGNSYIYDADEPAYFYKIVGDKVLIDFGTGSMRGMGVYWIENFVEVRMLGYMGLEKLEDSKFFFQHPLNTREDDFIKPDCPPELVEMTRLGGLGYIENQIYYIENDSLVKTGIIECQYYE